VTGQFNEQQTVWMVTADAAGAAGELLPNVSLAESAVVSAATGALKSAAGKTADDIAKSAPPAAKKAADAATPDAPAADGTAAVTESGANLLNRSPADRLAKFESEELPLLTTGRGPVIRPADWTRLRTELQTARMLIAADRKAEFHELFDGSLRKAAQALTLQNSATQDDNRSAVRQAISDWVSPDVAAAPDELALLRRTMGQLVAAPDQVQRLEPAFLDSGRPRQLLAAAIGDEVRGMAESIADAPVPEQARRIGELRNRMNNLAVAGWPLDQWPQSFVTVQEVLQSNPEPASVVAVLPELAKLLRRQSELLRMQSGQNEAGAALRTATWRAVTDAADVGLMQLLSAERWLTVGPAALPLARNRLQAAEQIASELTQTTIAQQRLSAVVDEQRALLPALIQYLALVQEDSTLPREELEAFERLATKAADQSLQAADYPRGQLDVIGFTPAHIDALFALTRNLEASPVVAVDEQHLELLTTYASTRLAGSGPLSWKSATELRRLLTIPLPEQAAASGRLLQPGPAKHTAAPQSGIRLAFWSLRLLQALDPQRDFAPAWRQWGDLVAAVAANKPAEELIALRAKLASTLRASWIEVMSSRMTLDEHSVFPPVEDIAARLLTDVTRRLNVASPAVRAASAAAARRLASGPAPGSNAPAVALATAAPDIELSTSGTASAALTIAGADSLYVLSPGLQVTNQGVEVESDWYRLAAADQASMNLDLAARDGLRQPQRVQVVAVNSAGAAVATTALSVHPPSDTRWQIEVVRVEKENPAGTPLVLAEPDARTRRLTLLPSTLNPVTGMPDPLPLRVRLKRVAGITRSVRVRLSSLPADPSGTPAPLWPDAVTLALADGVDVVELPLVPPVDPAAPPTPPAASAGPVVFDVSNGLLIEITPTDLLNNATVAMVLQPEFADPAQFIQPPQPRFNTGSNFIEVPLARANDPIVGALKPSALPVEVIPGRRLAEFVQPGASLRIPDLPSAGQQLTVALKPEIDRELNRGDWEFGLSVAGIPHAWWFTMSGGAVQQIAGDRPVVRTFLSVDEKPNLKIVRGRPLLIQGEENPLLLGAGWPESTLRTSAYIHGGQLDQGRWNLSWIAVRQPEASANAVPLGSFSVRKRYVETTTLTPGEAGAWMVSTSTQPWSVPAFQPGQYGLTNGRYEIVAALEQQNSGVEPVSSTVGVALDDGAPDLPASRITVTRPKTRFDQPVTGKVRVVDEESGVREVRIGMLPDKLKTLTVTPGYDVTTEFVLEPSEPGFPKLEQQETDHQSVVRVYVEADNFAGQTVKEERDVTIFRPGKAAAPGEMPPGGLEVTFNSGSEYVVSVSGPESPDPKTGVGSVAFSPLKPGKYKVSWKTKVGGLGAGEASVTVKSGETAKVVGRK
jgi:hypothetical protein